MCEYQAEKGGGLSEREGREVDAKSLHWFSVARLFEYLWGHVARRPTRRCQDVERFFVHDAGEAEVGYQQIGVVFWGTE